MHTFNGSVQTSADLSQTLQLMDLVQEARNAHMYFAPVLQTIIWQVLANMEGGQPKWRTCCLPSPGILSLGPVPSLEG